MNKKKHKKNTTDIKFFIVIIFNTYKCTKNLHRINIKLTLKI